MSQRYSFTSLRRWFRYRWRKLHIDVYVWVSWFPFQSLNIWSISGILERGSAHAQYIVIALQLPPPVLICSPLAVVGAETPSSHRSTLMCSLNPPSKPISVTTHNILYHLRYTAFSHLALGCYSRRAELWPTPSHIHQHCAGVRLPQDISDGQLNTDPTVIQPQTMALDARVTGRGPVVYYAQG